VVENEMSFEELYLLSELDLKGSMEKFFNDKTITPADMNQLKDKLVSGELSIKKIYEIKSRNYWYVSLSKIVRSDWIRHP